MATTLTITGKKSTIDAIFNFENETLLYMKNCRVIDKNSDLNSVKTKWEMEVRHCDSISLKGIKTATGLLKIFKKHSAIKGIPKVEDSMDTVLSIKTI